MEPNIYRVFPNESYMDLTLYQYGRESCTPAHSYGPAIRNHYLFHFILNGKGTLYSNSTNGQTHVFHLKKHEGFLISPRQVNTYIADERDPWEYAWIEFDGLKAKEWLDNAGLSCNTPIFKTHKKENIQPMIEELKAIIYGHERSSLYQIGHLYTFLDLMVHSSFYYKNLNTVKLKEVYIQQAITFVEQNYHLDITIEDIATFCNLNRSYLGKLFKEMVNKTPQQFLILYRMNQASELLRFTELSIAEIGKSVGYPNQLHFSRAFKNIYHIPPSQWRKEHKKF